jgi:prolyl oligopeptidase
MATAPARFLIRAAVACSLLLLLESGANAQRLAYPAAPRGNVVDDYHGTKVADPYRWLEQTDSPESRAWIDAEHTLTTAYLAALPMRDRVRSRLAELSPARDTGVPWREGGRLLFTERRGEEQQASLYEIPRAGAEPRVLFDPNQISPDGSIAIGDYVVSPDGKRVAYSRSEGGADVSSIRVRDLVTGTDLADEIVGINACWTRDSRGFFYAQSFQRAAAAAGSARAGVRAYYHALGTQATADRMLKEWDASARWLYFMASEDGRYALMVAEKGITSDVFCIDLGDRKHPNVNAPPFPVMHGWIGFHTPVEWVKDRLYMRTLMDAPNGRVVMVDLDRLEAAPRVMVPECSDVITDAVITGDRLVVNYLSDVHSVVRIFNLQGKPRKEIPLPGIGTVGWPLSGRPSTPELFFTFDSFLAPPVTYTCDVRSNKVSKLRSATVTFDASRYETKQVFFQSKDRTPVHMFITAARGIALDGSHPVFLTAYGGYGAVTGAHYAPDIPLWLEAGGIYVVASIRGGGEYGETWHKAGMLDKKQNSFDDFIASAEYLIDKHYTSPGKIAIYGHSNGGLLIGAVLTQRPDLFGAAVANAGHYDMLRYQKFTAGAAWVSEFGSADNAADFKYLYAYSPLQNVKPGTCYPPTLLLAADHDDRVVPSHAYKFAAALQAAQSCDAPILLRVAKNASHEYSSRQEMIDEHADMWAFIVNALGVNP